MTATEYGRLSWRDLALECLAHHNPTTMFAFWFLLGLFAAKVREQGAETTFAEIMELAAVYRDEDLVARLTRMAETGTLRAAR